MKKFLSVLIVLNLILQCICVSASEYSKTEQNTAQTAYELLQFIGLMPVENSYALVKDNYVTRGEFAVYISEVFSLGEVVDKSNMSDSVKTAVRNVTATKIMLGDETGFRESDPITVSEMAIMSVRALGYKKFNTVWGMNEFLKKAHELDILDGIKTMDKATVSDCTVLLYNVLHTNSAKELLDLEIEEGAGKTPLEMSYNLKYVKGQVTANAYASFSGEKTTTRNLIRIGTELYHTDAEEITDFLGYNVIAYYCADDNDGSIKYFVPDTDNDTIVINSEDFEEFTADYIKYADGSRSERIPVASDVVIIKNSKLVTTDYKSAFEMGFGTVTCISHDNEDYSVIIIDAYENYEITRIDISKKVIYTDRTDENGQIIKIDLENSDYAELVNVTQGKKFNENTLQPGDLISVAMSEDGKIIRGYLCDETVNGSIEKIETGNGINFVINGTEYKVDPYFYEAEKPEVGDKGNFTLDFAGRIAGYSDTEGESAQIGYVYRLFRTEGDESLMLSIYTTDKKHLTLKVKEKVKINGTGGKDTAVENKLCTKTGGALKRQLISFKVNSEGEISAIDTAAENKDARRKENMLYTLLPEGSYYWYYQMKSFARKYIVSKNTYYMRVPPENSNELDKSLFGCTAFSNVTWYNSNGNKSILGLYKFSDETPFADIMLVSNTDRATLVNTTEVTMISSFERAIGPGDEVVTAVHGYRRGNEVTAYIPDEIFRNDIGEGDLIRFTNNIYGYVGDYEIIYDVSEDKVMWAQGSTADEYSSNISSPAAGLRYTFGYVNDLYIAPFGNNYNSVIQIGKVAGETDDIYQMDASTAATTRYIIYDSNRHTDKVYMGHLDEIVPYTDCKNADETSRVFIHTRSGWLIAVFIYK